MALATNTSEIVAVIASLALLTPLVRAFHRWHIDLRKTSNGDKVATGQRQPLTSTPGASRWSELPRFERWALVINTVIQITCSGALLVLFLSSSHTSAATQRDVALVGLLLSTLIATAISNERLFP